ncbi:glycosyltransferase family 2 protein [Bacteroides ovatus]|uniref:glycosyltransferase family 2 protein n=1 Tax=Bacteroides ovatus TaxID=28116 RepID=UPI00314551CD
MQVIVSIVLFNPDIKRLCQNIEAILPQVNEVVIVDNGSKNIVDILEIINVYSNISFIRNDENLGIATALNQAARFALEHGYDWIITLDQDSVAPKNLVATYSLLKNETRLGMMCCKICDRNFGEKRELRTKTTGVEEVKMCITSASMMNLEAWKLVGGFSDDFFIDSVDFDICLSMREYGYKIIRTNDAVLLHEVGHSKLRYLFGKEYQIYQHSPLRYYYMVRNGIYLGKRHHFVIRAIYRSLRLFMLVMLYENDRIAKAKMMGLGYWHALINKYGKLQY